MAIYNEILVGRYARAIQRLFGMKGEVPVKQLAGEVNHECLVDSFLNFENRVLMTWRSFASATNATGGAAQRSAVRWRNPAGSNVIAVVEKLQVFIPAADPSILSRGPTSPNVAYGDLTTVVGSGSVRDVRIGPVTSAVILSTSTNSGAVTGVTHWQAANVAGTSNFDLIFDSNQELVIGPGDQLTLWTNAANALTIQANAMWRERVMEEGEFLSS